MINWLKAKGRRRIFNSHFPEHYRNIIEARVPAFSNLVAEDQNLLCKHVAIFIREKHFEGCAGFEITDEVKLIIGCQACLLILYHDTAYFPTVDTILVYPAEFIVPSSKRFGTEANHSEDTITLGEAWKTGLVILSWDGVISGASDEKDGSNLVFHEFAHHLDLESGNFDGIPPLPTHALRKQWKGVLSFEFNRFCTVINSGRETGIAEYGASNPAEFFACATESFFERPAKLRKHHGALYQLLRAYFRQDPLRPYSYSRRVTDDDIALSVPTRKLIDELDQCPVIKQGIRSLKILIYVDMLGGVAALWLMSISPKLGACCFLLAVAISAYLGAITPSVAARKKTEEERR